MSLASLHGGHDRRTFVIVGAAMEVRRTLGPGFLEHFYREALAAEMLRRAVPFDLAFDAADSTAFYCTELVLHCVNAAAGRLLIQGCTKINGKPVIAIDDTYLHDAMTPIPF